MSIKHRWAGGILAVLAAFIVGVYFDPVGAEPASDDPSPIVATSTGPVFQIEGSSIEVEKLYEIVPSESTFVPSSTLGSATKPTTGEFVYLTTIERFISLPSDVVLGRKPLSALSCPEAPCPDTPIQFFWRGNVEVGIDQSGNLYGSESDKALFPFFQEDE